MRPFQASLLSILLLFLSSLSAATSSSSYSPQLEILYWPVTDPEPSVLAHVSYNPASLKSDLIDYSSPAKVAGSSDELVRVGFYISTPENPKQWVGTLTSLSVLRGDSTQKPTLRLHISSANEVYHVSLISASASTSSPSSSSPSSPSDSLRIELVTAEPGPSPHLNRPVMVGPDGTNPEEITEKTLFQKYWWVALIISILAMSGGGERQ